MKKQTIIDDRQAGKTKGWKDFWQAGRTGRMTGRLAGQAG
jgi:hypothetical protein